MNFKLISLSVFSALLSTNALSSTLNYDVTTSYSKNATAILDGCVWKTKRATSPGEFPASADPLLLDNPWEKISCKMLIGNRSQAKKSLNPADYPEYKEYDLYLSGDIVRAIASVNLYQCLPGVSAWCSGSAWAYEPEKGSVSNLAWELLSSDTDNPSIDPVPPTEPVPPLDTGNGSDDNPTTNLFDYRNQTVGLTKATVQFNNKGIISAEKTSQESDYVVGGYVSEWSVYERGFDLERVAGKAYNRLVYAFAGICGDRSGESASDIVRKECLKQGLKEHEMVILDPWAGFIKPVNQRQERMGWHESYGANNPNLIPANKVRGLMGQLQELKRQNKHLKIAISIGGWTLSEPFHRMAASQEARNIFIASVIKFIYKWGLDGVDVDWEFPGHGGASGQWLPEDGEHFALLIKDMKNGLNALSKITGKEYEVSSAVGATKEHIDNIGESYKVVNQYIDNLYLMNYDFFGGWETKLGHQSNLRHSSALGADFSVENAVRLLQENGIDKSKIVVGIANYSRGSQASLYTSSPVSSGPMQPVIVFGTWESSVVEGYDLFPNMAGETLKGVNGWELRTDAEANADYYYNYQTNVFHSIDTPRTAYIKSKYAKDNGLKGVFVWTVEQDYNGQIVNAMNDGFGNPLTEIHATTQCRENLYNACGDNISQEQCNNLNGGAVTLGESIEDPEQLLSVKHLHLFNRHILIKKFRIWQGKKLVYESPNGLTAGVGNLVTNQHIRRDTRIEVLALKIRSVMENKQLFADNPEVRKLLIEYQKTGKITSRMNGFEFIADILGIPLSWTDLFLSIALKQVDLFFDSIKYNHFGWVDMDALNKAGTTEIMITNYGYNNTSVKAYR